jgi:hypothetical protein
LCGERAGNAKRPHAAGRGGEEYCRDEKAPREYRRKRRASASSEDDENRDGAEAESAKHDEERGARGGGRSSRRSVSLLWVCGPGFYLGPHI